MSISSEATSANMTSQIVNPMIAATIDAFGDMLDTSVTRTGLSLLQPGTSFYQISAVIGLTGEATGSFCLSFPALTAFEAVHRMLEIKVDSETPLVCDVVGELSNVIAGTAKDKLQALNLEVGLPNIIHGENHAIVFPSNSQPMVVTFDSEIGNFMLAFGFANG